MTQSAAERNPDWEAVEVGILKTLPVRSSGAVADKEVEATGIGKVIVFCTPLVEA